MATDDWSLKKEFDILSSAFTAEKTQYPPISHDRIDRIQQSINRNIVPEVSGINSPPIFADSVLNKPSWEIASDYYEETLDMILNFPDDQIANKITKLEAWFITLISPPPKNRTDIMVELWSNRELSKLDNNHTTNCPIDHQAYVKQNINKYLPTLWKEQFKTNFENAKKPVTKFQYVRVVRLSEILK